MIETIQLVDKRMPAGDMDRPPMRQTWYTILLGQAMKDPTLAGQLDVGPPPQHQADLDMALQRMGSLFLVRDTARTVEKQFCGVAGAMQSPVLYPTPLFASVLPINYEGHLPQDTETMATVYALLADYLLLDRQIPAIEVRVLDGIHADALKMAEFKLMCKIPKSVKNRRKWVDQFLFTRTGE